MSQASASRPNRRRMALICLTLGVGNGLTVCGIHALWSLRSLPLAVTVAVSGVLWFLLIVRTYDLRVKSAPSAPGPQESIHPWPQIAQSRLQLAEPLGDLHQLNQSLAHLAATLDQRGAQIETTSSTMAQIDTELLETAGNASAIGQSIEQAGLDLEELNTALQATRLRFDDSATGARQLQHQADRGLAVIMKALQQLQSTEGQSRLSQTAVDRLTGQTEEIGTVAEVIRELVADTELLAYNAAILAAKTGEDGQAFGVIAQEIKELADRTSASAGDIQQTLGGIRQETQALRSSVDATSHQIRLGIASSDAAGKAIQQLADLAAQTADAHTAVDQQLIQQGEQLRQLLGDAGLGFQSLRSLIQRLHVQKKRVGRLQRTVSGIGPSTADIHRQMDRITEAVHHMEHSLAIHQQQLQQPFATNMENPSASVDATKSLPV